jgi:hypothetical protein
LAYDRVDVPAFLILSLGQRWRAKHKSRRQHGQTPEINRAHGFALSQLSLAADYGPVSAAIQ